jgi:Mg-chelatase subunit ChlD
MKNKKTIYHFIIDKSGSMSGMEQQAVSGFNTQLATLQELKQTYPEQEFKVSLTYFNHHVQDIILNGSVDQILPMDPRTFDPGGSTALLDAIGKSIYQLKSDFETELKKDEATVVMVIITDGAENASRLYTYHEVARMIKELDETGKWTFSFLGADLDAIHTSQMLNIRKENVISFSKSNYSGMMNDVSISIRTYAQSKSHGNAKNNIFDIFEKKDRRQP